MCFRVLWGSLPALLMVAVPSVHLGQDCDLECAPSSVTEIQQKGGNWMMGTATHIVSHPTRAIHMIDSTFVLNDLL